MVADKAYITDIDRLFPTDQINPGTGDVVAAVVEEGALVFESY
jgi:hypothetical protein